MKKKRKGFTLVEIMVVVAVVGLLSALAITNILRLRMSANETYAATSLKRLSTVMESWRSVQIPATYNGASLDSLMDSEPPYIDTKLGSGSKHGYSFVLNLDDPQSFHATATPLIYRINGIRSFIVHEDGVIMGDDNSGDPLHRGEGEAVD